MNDGVHVTDHRTVDHAADGAVDHDGAGFVSHPHGFVDVKGRELDELVAKDEQLRQDEHDEDDGDAGTSGQTFADARDTRVRGHACDEHTRENHHRTRGDNRREGKIERLDNRFFPADRLAQLRIARRDDDGVVDVGTHLNGRHDEVA